MKRKRLAGIVLAGAVASAIAIGAIVAPGYEAIEPELDGAAVWAPNASDGRIGLVNTAISSIESIVAADGAANETVQSDRGVLVIDRAASTVRAVDAATGALGAALPIPSASDVQLVGDRVAIAAGSTGDVWLTDLDAVRAGEPLGDPVAELGLGGVIALGTERLFAASPGLRRVLTIDVASRDVVGSESARMSPTAPALQITALGDRWVLLDEQSRVLSSGSWQTSIDAAGARLQRPGPARDAVLVATDEGLERHALGLQATETLVGGMEASAIAPVVAGECTFAAWSSGAAWRSCGDGRNAVPMVLDGVDATSRLSILHRGTATILSDAASGATWAIDREGARIDDWGTPETQRPAPDVSDEEQPGEQSPTLPDQAPPVANDDELGARPGRVTELPVLLNDSDPNGDPLMIVGLDESQPVRITGDGRRIRLELPADAAGVLDVPYTISDGHGGEASAVARVSVRGPDENASPVQARASTLDVTASGTGVASVLDDWLDPDGDPLVLVDATPASPDLATHRADGRIEFRDAGAGPVRDVALAVSDGTATAFGSLTVSATPTAPALVAEPVTARGPVGQPLVLEPLLAAHGGAGPISLHNVNAPAALPYAFDDVAGTIEVTPATLEPQVFTYVVSDGQSTATGAVRIDPTPAVDPATPPVTVPHAVSVLPGGSVEVPVAGVDVDPAGGVLLVTSATSPDASIVRADVIGQRDVRIQLVGPTDGAVHVTYVVSNGVTSATGTIVVVELPPNTQMQAPIARDDVVRVRPGGTVDIAPLANDEQPDGGRLTLSSALVDPIADGDGLMFVAGDRLRFVAPETPGTATAVYRVEGPDGQSAQARATVEVVATDAATNAAPVPRPAEARVVAGETVSIPVELNGIDPNGDDVQLLGQVTPASLGTISVSDASTLRYTAGEYALGTETIAYQVADSSGARATGVIRIGISPPDAVVAAPVPQPDAASMRPGTSLAVSVLENDTDPGGLGLTIVRAQTTTPGASVEVADASVIVHAPEAEGEVGVVYTLENSRGATAVAWLRVDVREDAAPPAPRVEDIIVPLRSIINQDTVHVDLLGAASVADGLDEQLAASLPLRVDGVQMTGGELDIQVQERTRIVPFTIERADAQLTQTALVLVPGTLDSLPQATPGLDPIRVQAGESVLIDIDDRVDAADGGGVLLTDASLVRASHATDDTLVVDDRTLRYTPAPGYFGPANIAFEVTDGDYPGDPDGRTARIVLPILVVPDDDVPPRVNGSTIQLEPGQRRTIDLARLTSLADPARAGELTFDVRSAVPAGFTATLAGSSLEIAAASTATPGAPVALTVGVRLGDLEGIEGTLTLAVISSTRARAEAAPDLVLVTRGTQAVSDVLANDEATNPFPEVPLVVDSIAGLGALPAGVSAEVAPGGSQIVVTASAVAPITSATLRYRVLDATRDPQRAVWGVVTIRVQDVPAQPAPPVQDVSTYVDGTVTMRITPPADNNSPILGYRLIAPGYEHDCGLRLVCTLADLPAGVDHRVQVVARNAIGSSAPSLASAPVHVDRLPAAPATVQATPTANAGELRVSWSAVGTPAGGTPVTGYLARISGQGVDTTMRLGAEQLAAVVPGLVPGASYTIQVAATNATGVTDAQWRYSSPISATAVGPPGQTAVFVESIDAASGAVRFSWAPASPAGGREVKYTAQIVSEASRGSHGCSSSGTGTPSGNDTSPATRTLSPDARQVIMIVADNGWFCSISYSGVLQGLPSQPAQGALGIDRSHAGTRDALDLQVTTVQQLPAGQWMQVRVAGGAWTDVAVGQFLTPAQGVAYGSAPQIEARACAASGAGQWCGPTRGIASATIPISLLATIDGVCQQSQPLIVTVPNNGGVASGAMVTFRGGPGQSTTVPYVPGGVPVPIGTTSVDVAGTADGATDPVPTTAACTL